VFFTDAIVPDRDRIGELGQGWQIVLESITNERFAIGAEIVAESGSPMPDLMEVWRDLRPDDPILRDKVTQAWVEGQVLRWYSNLGREAYKAGSPGAAAAIGKLAFTQYVQRAYELAVDVMGNDGILFDGDYELEVIDSFGFAGHDPRRNYLAARGRTIGGGTSEVVKTNLAERELGLPREPRPAPAKA
jgi:alkylation response protein AidB-like acyl-CoA dehydrogenase